MHARQILLYVSKLLKPYEICIRSYRRKAYNIIQPLMNSMHGYNERINKIYITKDEMNILNQKMKVTQVVEYDTNPLDEGIGSEP